MRDQPMHAGFGSQQPERVVAGDGDRGALDAGLVAVLVVDDLALEAAALAPLQVHLEQHRRPVLRLGAAGARMDRDDGVAAVVLAAQHLPRLGGLDVGLELVEALGQLRLDRLAGLGPFHQDGQVIDSAPQASRSATSSSSRRRRRCSSFCASDWSFQKSGSLARASILSSSTRWPGASKIAPQIGGPLHQVLVSLDLIVELERHAATAPMLATNRDSHEGAKVTKLSRMILRISRHFAPSCAVVPS